MSASAYHRVEEEASAHIPLLSLRHRLSRLADDITSPTSSIITSDVVEAYSKIAGDFHRCLPYALLEARRYFRRQAYLNPSDSDENEGRKLACEALARKIVARTSMAEQYSLLSARFTVIESDGDESLPLSGELPVLLLCRGALTRTLTFLDSSRERG